MLNPAEIVPSAKMLGIKITKLAKYRVEGELVAPTTQSQMVV
jgi:hypothetical protein